MTNKGDYGTSPYNKIVLATEVATASDQPYPVSFLADAQTGVYRKGAGQLGIGVNGTEVANTTPTGVLPTFTVAGWFAEGIGSILTAAGNSLAGAPLMNGNYNFIGSALSATGVALPCSTSIGLGGGISIFNQSTNNITVYGSGGDTVDATTGTTGVTLSVGKRCLFLIQAAGKYISAQFGAVSS